MIMADNVHFGIIDTLDKTKHYDQFYYPDNFQQTLRRFQCINIPDDVVNKWAGNLLHVKTHYCRYGRTATGLAQCAVTLIPPESLNEIIDVVQQHKNSELDYHSKMEDLLALLKRALIENKWVIHFGL